MEDLILEYSEKKKPHCKISRQYASNVKNKELYYDPSGKFFDNGGIYVLRYDKKWEAINILTGQSWNGKYHNLKKAVKGLRKFPKKATITIKLGGGK